MNRLKGANMDIDFSCKEFGNSKCPWNEAENTDIHKCAVENTSICKYFKGVEYLDTLLCSYPEDDKLGISRQF